MNNDRAFVKRWLSRRPGYGIYRTKAGRRLHYAMPGDRVAICGVDVVGDPLTEAQLCESRGMCNPCYWNKPKED